DLIGLSRRGNGDVARFFVFASVAKIEKVPNSESSSCSFSPSTFPRNPREKNEDGEECNDSRFIKKRQPVLRPAAAFIRRYRTGLEAGYRPESRLTDSGCYCSASVRCSAFGRFAPDSSADTCGFQSWCGKLGSALDCSRCWYSALARGFAFDRSRRDSVADKSDSQNLGARSDSAHCLYHYWYSAFGRSVQHSVVD